jgi:hypothetical protein
MATALTAQVMSGLSLHPRMVPAFPTRKAVTTHSQGSGPAAPTPRAPSTFSLGKTQAATTSPAATTFTWEIPVAGRPLAAKTIRSASEATVGVVGYGAHSATYIAGIYGATSSGGVPVYINSNWQLGTLTSSRRFKEQIRDMGEKHRRAHEAAARDPSSTSPSMPTASAP